MTKIIVFLLLFALPFLVLPFGASQFETPKIIVAEVGIEIIIFLEIIRNGKILNISRKYLFLIGILFALTIVDLIFLRTNTSFFGNPFRLQGIFLLWHLIIFSIVARDISVDKFSPKIFFILLIGLLISIPLFGNNPAGRAIGTQGEPNFLAATAIFFWPFIYSSLRKRERRNGILLLITLIITAIILFLTKSHSAMIGFGLQLIFIALTKLGRLKMKWSLIICLVLLSASLVLPFVTPRDPYEDRATIWQLSVAAIAQKPIIGYGFGNVEKILMKEIVENKTRLQGYYVDSAHNFLLDYLLSGGVVALIAILFIVKGAFSIFVLQNSTRNILLLIGLVSVMFFNPAGITTLLAFWWTVSQGNKGDVFTF